MASVKTIIAENGKKKYQGIAYLGYVNGKQIRKKKTFAKKGDAQAWAQRIESEYEKGDIIIKNSNITYADYLKDWLVTQKNEVNVTTFIHYKSQIKNYLIPILGKYKIGDITESELKLMYSKLLDEKECNLAISTARKVMQTAHKSLRNAFEDRKIKRAPKIKLQMPQKSKITTWNEDEIKAFLNVTKDTYIYFSVFLALNSGMRNGELCGLRWEDVDFEDGCIHVRNQIVITKEYKSKKMIVVKEYGNLTLTSTLKTPQSKRKIYLTIEVLNVLKVEKEERGAFDDDFVIIPPFCFEHNVPYSPDSFRNTFLRAQRRVNKQRALNNLEPLTRLKIHDLRHTHATILINRNVNVKIVSMRLGHSTINETLNTYCNIDDTTQKSIINNTTSENNKQKIFNLF